MRIAILALAFLVTALVAEVIFVSNKRISPLRMYAVDANGIKHEVNLSMKEIKK